MRPQSTAAGPRRHHYATAANHAALALEAAQNGDRTRAMGHLLDIDPAAWPDIRDRLADLGLIPPTH